MWQSLVRDCSRWVLLFLYFTLGMVWRVSAFATANEMQKFGVSIPDMSLWGLLLYAPWMIKPALGLTSDAFACWGGLHRVPYIVVNNLLAGVFSLSVLAP